MRLRAPISMLTAAVAALILAACGASTGSTNDTGSAATSTASEATVPAAPKITDVVLVTHDSWSLPTKVVAAFEAQTGYHLVVRSSGDAGQLTNKLVLSAGDPDGDVSFGVDNTFAGRALSNDVFAAYTPVSLPAGVSAYDVAGDAGAHLTPVDNSAVCVNVDTSWFAAHHLAPPANLSDLTTPAYKGLLVTEGASTSSVGMAFLLTTIAAFSTTTDPDGWQGYWQALLANGLKVDDSWDNAFDVDYTLGGGSGKYPIVVSYDSDPASTVKDGKTSSQALLNTCFGQVEYAGVLAGAKNVPGAEAFVDFLLSRSVQQALPTSMYVFPVVSGIRLPATWAKFAIQPMKPWTVDPAQIDANRETWLQQWTDLVQK